MIRNANMSDQKEMAGKIRVCDFLWLDDRIIPWSTRPLLLFVCWGGRCSWRYLGYYISTLVPEWVRRWRRGPEFTAGANSSTSAREKVMNSPKGKSKACFCISTHVTSTGLQWTIQSLSSKLVSLKDYGDGRYHDGSLYFAVIGIVINGTYQEFSVVMKLVCPVWPVLALIVKRMFTVYYNIVINNISFNVSVLFFSKMI